MPGGIRSDDTIEGQEAKPWKIASGDVLGMAVIDHYNHMVVCMKSFRYLDDVFTLIQ